MTKDPRIDAYIAKAAPFAQECLIVFREIIHNYCPDVEETIKWGFPHYLYKGKIVCSTAAFKKHCALGFWLHQEMSDQYGLFKREQEGGMGSIGKLTGSEDLPNRDHLGAYILEAMSLIDQGVKSPTAKREPKKLIVPEDLQRALAKNPKAQQTFEAFSNTHKREYIDWIEGAKRLETRTSRLEKTLANLEEGKSKEWKYK